MNSSAKTRQAKPVKPDRAGIRQGRDRFILQLIVLAASAFILYGNTLRNDYALDDAFAITNNRYTTQGISGIPDLMTKNFFSGYLGDEAIELAGGRYRPLSLVTFALEVEVFGLNPALSHFINILIYILTGTLILLLLQAMIRQKTHLPWYATLPFVTALLFLFHPLHTEAVANIKGRDELLSMLFSLLSLWYALKYADTGRAVNLAAIFISFLLAIFSKENAVTFVFVIPLTIWFFRDVSLRKTAPVLLPVVAAFGIFMAMRGLALQGSAASHSSNLMDNPFLEASLAQKHGTIFYTFWEYLRLLFFPHPLTWDYYPFHISYRELFSFQSLAPLILYAAILVYGLVRARSKGIIAYAILFYFATFSIVSNLPVNLGTFMAERFLYMPSFGFCLLLGWALASKLPLLYTRIAPGKMLMFALTPILVLYALKTVSRNADWKDDFTLYTTDAVTSANSAKGTNIAGQYYAYRANQTTDILLKQQYFESALSLLGRAVQIYPGHIDAWFYLGNVHYDYRKDVAALLRCYEEVLKRNPGTARAYQNARMVLQQEKETGLRISGYRMLLSYDSTLADIRYDLALAYMQQRQMPDSAWFFLEPLLSRGTPDANALKYAGYLKYQMGDYTAAAGYFTKALEITPDDAETRKNLEAAKLRESMP
jgi:tetratricopeptide (TPR) repeat protein